MYNKNQFNQINDRKVLHKVKKCWETVSIAMLGLIGGGAVTTVHVNAKASDQDVDQANHSMNVSRLRAQRPRLINDDQANHSPQFGVHQSGSQVTASNHNVNITEASKDLHNQIIQNAIKQPSVLRSVSANSKPRVVTGNYAGLNYRYQPANQSVEFTDGALTWNGSRQNAFIGTNDDAPEDVHTARAVKFDPAIDMSHVNNLNGMFRGDMDVQSIDLSGLDTRRVATMNNVLSGDSNLMKIVLGPNSHLNSGSLALSAVNNFSDYGNPDNVKTYWPLTPDMTVIKDDDDGLLMSADGDDVTPDYSRLSSGTYYIYKPVSIQFKTQNGSNSFLSEGLYYPVDVSHKPIVKPSDRDRMIELINDIIQQLPPVYNNDYTISKGQNYIPTSVSNDGATIPVIQVNVTVNYRKSIQNAESLVQSDEGKATSYVNEALTYLSSDQVYPDYASNAIGSDYGRIQQALSHPTAISAAAEASYAESDANQLVAKLSYSAMSYYDSSMVSDDKDRMLSYVNDVSDYEVSNSSQDSPILSSLSADVSLINNDHDTIWGGEYGVTPSGQVSEASQALRNATSAYDNAQDLISSLRSATATSTSSSVKSKSASHASSANSSGRESKSVSLSRAASVASASMSISASQSKFASLSRAASVAANASVRASASRSASLSRSASQSRSASLSQSASISNSVAASQSASLSQSRSMSNREASSASASQARSASLSASVASSIRTSLSVSASASTSVSEAQSIQNSISASTFASFQSASQSQIASRAASAQASASVSQSVSQSVSASVSTSQSESVSTRASLSGSIASASLSTAASIRARAAHSESALGSATSSESSQSPASSASSAWTPSRKSGNGNKAKPSEASSSSSQAANDFSIVNASLARVIDRDADMINSYDQQASADDQSAMNVLNGLDVAESPMLSILKDRDYRRILGNFQLISRNIGLINSMKSQVNDLNLYRQANEVNEFNNQTASASQEAVGAQSILTETIGSLRSMVNHESMESSSNSTDGSSASSESMSSISSKNMRSENNTSKVTSSNSFISHASGSTSTISSESVSNGTPRATSVTTSSSNSINPVNLRSNSARSSSITSNTNMDIESEARSHSDGSSISNDVKPSQSGSSDSVNHVNHRQSRFTAAERHQRNLSDVTSEDNPRSENREDRSGMHSNGRYKGDETLAGLRHRPDSKVNAMNSFKANGLKVNSRMNDHHRDDGTGTLPQTGDALPHDKKIAEILLSISASIGALTTLIKKRYRE